MKCGMLGDTADVIVCAIFGDCRLIIIITDLYSAFRSEDTEALRGVGVVRGVNLSAPILLILVCVS